MKKIICVSIAILLTLPLVACFTNKEKDDNLPGRIVGSTSDGADKYIGWWKLNEPGDEISFFYVEIAGSGGVSCYSEDGILVDTGGFDYDAQRALNGNPLIVLVMGELGDYAGYPYSTNSGLRMDIKEWKGDAKGLFELTDAPGFASNKTEGTP